MPVRSLNPRLYTVVVHNVTIRGFVDGDAVTIAPENDSFADYVGTDGEVSRVDVNDPRRAVTIRLAQTSPSNDFLSSLAKSGAVGPFSFSDLSGTTELHGDCWVKRRPDQAFGREVGTREWTLMVVAAEELVGGNELSA